MNIKHYLAASLVGGMFAISQQASAASFTYILDQTNSPPFFTDGIPYLWVTIDNEGAAGTSDQLINFKVETVFGFTETAGSFGIDSFGFNNTTGNLTAGNLNLPANWNESGPPPSNQDGFGAFDWTISTSGAGNRLDPLEFSIDLAGDDIADYAGPSSGNAGEGNAWFAAHVAGFETGAGEDGCSPINGVDCKELTSGWFGGGDENNPPNEVPVPAAVWLFGSGLLGLVGVARRSRKA
jgi:hypothetical protein